MMGYGTGVQRMVETKQPKVMLTRGFLVKYNPHIKDKEGETQWTVPRWLWWNGYQNQGDQQSCNHLPVVGSGLKPEGKI